MLRERHVGVDAGLAVRVDAVVLEVEEGGYGDVHEGERGDGVAVGGNEVVAGGGEPGNGAVADPIGDADAGAVGGGVLVVVSAGGVSIW